MMAPRLGGLLLAGLVGTIAACGGGPSPTPLPACPQEAPTAAGAQAELEDGAQTAVVETNRGSFTIELNGAAAPLATANFVALARCGFYDDVTFHRVLAGFVIQAGDPQTKTQRGDFAGLGTGGPGYQFEIELPPEELAYDPYSVAMANAGQADTNGSQFFVALADLDDRLPRQYTIFGRVVEGTEVVDDIGGVPVNDPQIGVPVEESAVIIQAVRIGLAEETPAP